MTIENPVTVDIPSLIFNAERLREKVGPFYCVLKSDAYGHGATRCAKALYSAGFRHFAVYSLAEAMQIKPRIQDADVLILGRTPSKYADVIAKNAFIQTVGSKEYVRELAPSSKGLRIHIKLDTGMNRGGFKSEPDEIVKAFLGFTGSIEGVYTHFNRAQDESLLYTERQLESFKKRAAFLQDAFGHSLQKHAAASAASVRSKASRLDICRIGIALYGGFDEIYSELRLRPVMSLYGSVCEIKKVKKGESVGYGSDFTAENDMFTATVSLGYGNGIARCASNFAPILNGVHAPLIGRVCMDRCMLDITPLMEKGTPVSVYDTVEFFGKNAPVSRLCAAEGTIAYETLLKVGNLNRRRYKA